MTNKPTLIERMALHTDRSPRPDGCWVWTGYLTRGYGRVRDGEGRISKPHRVAWEMAHGARLLGQRLHVLHHCDNPSCVNAAHLWLGTHDENMADMVAKRRCRKNFDPAYAPRTIKGMALPDYYRWRRKVRKEALQ